MKKIKLILILISVATTMYGQQIITSLRTDRVWFVGGSVGTAIPINTYSYDAKLGTNYAANFGYMFSEVFGLLAKGYMINNELKESFSLENSQMKGVGGVFGPFIALRPTDLTEIGLHLLFGATDIEMPHNKFKNNDILGFTSNLGASFRLNLNMLMIFCDVDYFSTDPKFEDKPYVISNITTTIGVAVRFKREY